MSNSEPHVPQPVKQLYDVAKKNLSIVVEKSFIKLLIVSYLGHEIGFNTFNTVKPVHVKNAAIHTFPPPTTKIKSMRLIGSMNFYFKYIDKHKDVMKPLSGLIHDKFNFHWNEF